MSRLMYLFAAVVMAAALVSQNANAQQVHDGVTFAELQAALSAGRLQVEADKVEGKDILWAKGKNHVIAVYLVHCGDQPRCEGVKYIAVLPESVTTETMNKFNRNYNYSKLALADDGKLVISVELLAVGGVAPTNLVQNALGLMYRMTQFKELTVQASAAPPPGQGRTSMLAARASEGWNERAPKPRYLHVDPALQRAVVARLRAGD
jgi:hypothetical protein